MAVSVDNRPSRLRAALAGVLTILILVPAGLLFLRVWQQNETARDSTHREQLGVDYLAGLSPLVSALAEAQSSALQGVSAPPASLTAAVAGVTSADQRLGDALGTRERWTGLRDKIGSLPSVTGSPAQVFQAHVEVTDLALALYDAVLDNSGLSRDPDNDVSHLQEALGVDLPGAVVQVSRMGDLSLMLAGLSGSGTARDQAQTVLGAQFGAAVHAANSNVGRLTDNLQAAVDDTGSTTLSGRLVSTVDGFRRGVEAFMRGASINGATPPSPAALATAQSQLQTSLGSLAGVVVREMGGLLKDRIDRLDSRRIEALALAGAAVLLAVTAALLWITAFRRRAPAPPPRDGPDTAVNAPGSGRYGGNPYDPVPSYGHEVHPTRRERSGALR